MLIIVGGALLLHRGSDVSRLEALLMAFIFFFSCWLRSSGAALAKAG